MQSSLRHELCRHKSSHRREPQGGRTAFPLAQKGSKVPEKRVGHPAENQVLGSQVPPLRPAEHPAGGWCERWAELAKAQFSRGSSAPWISFGRSGVISVWGLLPGMGR